ncbi:hypothetical protein A3K34_03335 [candidate division WWE3 bacterium RIFOXYC1_FULL_40_10]|uniref:Uncharacterized protein n=1 Tax=candidate division WWE3 bacterium RIFOXYA2_FULL_46_9 TaxID=1802636 RepID=A0A1F4VZ05_UNCKA|nr:MAG: hypothetical protein A3K58_03335 [candidate division WWE3 bacterium RIFOXYB1_FULL_40_22]OGC61881.1 MAG: hypothetical protein A3K37_03335 [candidate division WWE3 bacterium RIFOXYA1_FULL_40_11]OGC62248.1 MAG: hypothetical protein A2264_03095 [candidate division WWE3 bacterium RIFOXYA2_FULL_46_9]OGC64354.1 MAG: hypothetical protein A2326_00750 [candidate division WWE3 bacterium RIFOXYB2_FULL_41_6]OGC66264.1 MAG: hypothetical protein A3K34_03335 [candidate division WWE3 bacterium RIFOXYC1_
MTGKKMSLENFLNQHHLVTVEIKMEPGYEVAVITFENHRRQETVRIYSSTEGEKYFIFKVNSKQIGKPLLPRLHWDVIIVVVEK